MLTRFNNQEVVIRRLRASSGSKKVYIATATADGSIQNIDTTDAQSKEGIAGKTYKGFFDIDTNIAVNDVLTDDQGHKYRVLALEKMGGGLGLSSEHLEVVMTHYDG